MKEKILHEIETGTFHLSYSRISRFVKSPAHFLNYLEKKSEPTKAMQLGTALHEVLFSEIKSFVIGDFDRRKKEDKEMAEMIESEGKFIIKIDEYEILKYQVEICKNLLNEHDLLMNIVQTETRQETEIGGYKFVFIPDAETDNSVIELKRTADANPEKFRWEIINRSYDIQAAVYIHGTRKQNYFLLAVDDTAASLFCLTPQTLNSGMEKILKGIGAFNAWVATGMNQMNYNSNEIIML